MSHVSIVIATLLQHPTTYTGLYLPKSRILKRKTGGEIRPCNKLPVYSTFFNVLKCAVEFPNRLVGNARK